MEGVAHLSVRFVLSQCCQDLINLSVDVTCSPEPPEIPTHSEYNSQPADDGKVVISRLEYPTPSSPLLQREDYFLNSTWSNTLIPNNYMANLR